MRSLCSPSMQSSFYSCRSIIAFSLCFPSASLDLSLFWSMHSKKEEKSLPSPSRPSVRQFIESTAKVLSNALCTDSGISRGHSGVMALPAKAYAMRVELSVDLLQLTSNVNQFPHLQDRRDAMQTLLFNAWRPR